MPNAEIESVINKLKATSRHEYGNIDIKSGNLIIDAGPWGDTVGYKAKLSVIQKSIENNYQLSIVYHDRNGDNTTRIIEPHMIVFKQGLWYVFAYCHLRNDFRFFKTGRIEQATILNEKFIRRDLSNVELPLNFWETSVKTIDVVFEINKNSLSDIEEWLGIENVSFKNNKYIAEAKLPFDKGLVSKIMSYGNGIKVIEPKELIEEIKKCTNDIINAYK